MICPKCKSTKVAKILYGYPAPSKKLKEDLAKGKVVLGGCVIKEGSPAYECQDCKHRF